jgi:hypothetical protein
MYIVAHTQSIDIFQRLKRLLECVAKREVSGRE